jgi:hypothetical protein
MLGNCIAWPGVSGRISLPLRFSAARRTVIDRPGRSPDQSLLLRRYIFGSLPVRTIF